MARILWFNEKMVARFPAGTFRRIAVLLRTGEDRSHFVREAVEKELRRRKAIGPLETERIEDHVE